MSCRVGKGNDERVQNVNCKYHFVFEKLKSNGNLHSKCNNICSFCLEQAYKNSVKMTFSYEKNLL